MNVQAIYGNDKAECFTTSMIKLYVDATGMIKLNVYTTGMIQLKVQATGLIKLNFMQQT